MTNKSGILTECISRQVASTPTELRKAMYAAVQALDSEREHIGAVICSDDALRQLSKAFNGDTTYDRIVASRTLAGAPLGIDDSFHGIRLMNPEWTKCATIDFVAMK